MLFTLFYADVAREVLNLTQDNITIRVQHVSIKVTAVLCYTKRNRFLKKKTDQGKPCI